MNTGNKALFERIALAIQKMTTSNSRNFGSDCLLHASLATAALADAGVKAKVVFGAAAWRVGPNFCDVISHLLDDIPQDLRNIKALAFHAWVEYQDSILDFSTHSLTFKAAQLDALDGGTTTALWSPLYLDLKHGEVKTLQQVAESSTPGLAFYQEIPGLYEFMKVRGLCTEPTAQDKNAFRFILANTHLEVIGSNDFNRTRSLANIDQ